MILPRPSRQWLRRRQRAERRRRRLAAKRQAPLSFELLEERQLLAADFEWQMTPRVVADSNGRIAVPNNAAYAQPGKFEVVFDAAAARLNGSVPTSFRWKIDGGQPAVVTQSRFSTRLTEGLHNIQLDILIGSQVETGPVVPITVDDILVVGIGDSYSSGEGNPEVPLDGAFSAPEWMQVGDTSLYPPLPDSSPEGISATLNLKDIEQEQARYHALAHRSSAAATAQMALELERLDPHTSVTLVFVSASGGTIDEGALLEDPGKSTGEGTAAGLYDEDDPMPPQITQVAQIVGNRQIDVMNISLGGNESGFTRVAFAMTLRLAQDFDPTNPPTSDLFDELKTAINSGTIDDWEKVKDLLPVGLRKAMTIDKEIIGMGDLPAYYELLNYFISPQIDPLSLSPEAIAAAAHSGIPLTPTFANARLSARPKHIYLTEYPMPFTELVNGQVVPSAAMLDDLIPGLQLDAKEMEWVNMNWGSLLKQTQQDAAAPTANDWTFIDTINDAYMGHGYSAADEDRWLVTAPEAAQLQGYTNFLTSGNLHPNQRGTAATAKILTDQAIADVFSSLSPADQAALKDTSHTYFDEIISSPLKSTSAKTLASSLNNLIDVNIFSVPGVDAELNGLADLDGLWADLMGRLGETLTVEGSTTIGASVVASVDQGDASFMITVDDAGPVNIRVPLWKWVLSVGTAIPYTQAELVTKINAEIDGTALKDRVKASIENDLLKFTAESANSLTVTTLQLRADGPAPLNGRPDTVQPLQISVERRTDGNLATTPYAFNIGPTALTFVVGTETKTVPVSGNMNAGDLVIAINAALTALKLLDVRAVVDKGRNGQLDHNPKGLLRTDPLYPITEDEDEDRLVFVATGTSVVGINVSGLGADELGFVNVQSAYQNPQSSQAANVNPAWKLLNFSAANDHPGYYTVGGETIPEGLTDLMDAVIKNPTSALVEALKAKLKAKMEKALKDISQKAFDSDLWPRLEQFISTQEEIDDIEVDPVFANNELTFHIKLGHLFQRQTEWDLFDEGLYLGPLGTLEVGTPIDGTLIAPVKFDFDMGMYLGNLNESPLNPFRTGGTATFGPTTPLSTLNAEKGIPLLVGITALNAPNHSDVDKSKKGILSASATFTLDIEQYSSSSTKSYTITLKDQQVGNSIDPVTNDNLTPQHLADDLNLMFHQKGIQNLVRAGVLLDQDAQHTPRLYLEAVDKSVIGLKITGAGGELLGFGKDQDSRNLAQSKWADMQVQVGNTGAKIPVNLDGARTLGDVVSKINAAVGGTAIATINGSEQRLELSRPGNTLYVLPGVGAMGTANHVATADALGILRGLPTAVDAANPLPEEITGQPLHGLGYDDRTFIVTTGDTDKFAIGLGIAADKVSETAAIGPISVDLVGTSSDTIPEPDVLLLVGMETNFRDPGTQKLDDRLYFTEGFKNPSNVLDLNLLPVGPLPGQPPHLLADFQAHLEIVAGDPFLEDVLDPDGTIADDQFRIPINVSVATGNKPDWGIDNDGGGFDKLLASAKRMDVGHLVTLLRNAANYYKQNEDASYDIKIPLTDKTIGDFVDFADALLTAADDFISKIDVKAAQKASDDVRTTVSNLKVSYDARVRLFNVLDQVDRTLAHAKDVDRDSRLRLPSRMLASVRQLAKDIELETAGLTSANDLKLKQALDEARDKLIDLVPSMNTAADRLGKAIGDAINKKFGLTGSGRMARSPGVDVAFDFISDYDTDNGPSDQAALVMSIGYENQDLVDIKDDPSTELAITLGNKSVTLAQADIDFRLRAGLELNVGVGVTLDGSNRLFLIADDAPDVDLVPSKLTINAGMLATATGSLGIDTYDVIDGTAHAELRAAQVDTWNSPGIYDSNATTPAELKLTVAPAVADGRFLIVTAIYNPNTPNEVSEVMDGSADNQQYTLAKVGNDYYLRVGNWPGGSQPAQLTVEYLTGSISAAQAATYFDDLTKRASFDVTLDGVSPSFPNTIGAVTIDNLAGRLDVTSKGLLNANVDAEFAPESRPREKHYHAGSDAAHPLQPQFDFDKDALNQLFDGVGFNLKTLVAGINKFLDTLEDRLVDKLIAKFPIGGKDLAKKVQFIKKLRTALVTDLSKELSKLDPNDLPNAKQVIANVLETLLEDALKKNLNANDIDVEISLDPFSFEVNLDLEYGETWTVDFDSGLAGLPITGQGGVEAKLTFEAKLGFGINQDDGFYLKDRGADELKVTVGIGLLVDKTDPNDPIPTSLTVDLFGLKLSADGHPAGR